MIKIPVITGKSNIVSKAAEGKANLKFIPLREWCIPSADLKLVKNMR